MSKKELELWEKMLIAAQISGGIAAVGALVVGLIMLGMAL